MIYDNVVVGTGLSALGCILGLIKNNKKVLCIDASNELEDLIQEGRVKIVIIPDIESVNYGRGVGYEVIEHAPPEDIKEISATKIRKQLRDEGKL